VPRCPWALARRGILGAVFTSSPPYPALVSEADFIAAQDVNAAHGPAPKDEPVLRWYLLAGPQACTVGRPCIRWSPGTFTLAG